MEFAINPRETFPTAEIRSLNDIEIDHVNGGVAVGGYLVRLAEALAYRFLQP